MTCCLLGQKTQRQMVINRKWEKAGEWMSGRRERGEQEGYCTEKPGQSKDRMERKESALIQHGHRVHNNRETPVQATNPVFESFWIKTWGVTYPFFPSWFLHCCCCPSCCSCLLIHSTSQWGICRPTVTVVPFPHQEQSIRPQLAAFRNIFGGFRVCNAFAHVH